MLNLFELDIRSIKGVGEKRAELLRKMNLGTVGDVLYDFPFRYRDRTKLTEIFFRVPEGEVLFRGKVIKKYFSRTALFLDVSSELTRIRMTFFHSRFLSEKIEVGEDYYFFGTVKNGSMTNPEFASVLDETFLRILPVYHLTAGLRHSTAVQIHAEALAFLDREGIAENLPEELCRAEDLPSREEAIRELHRPSSFENIERARRRIVMEELYEIFCAVLKDKKRERVPAMERLSFAPLEQIPFVLTKAQKTAIADIRRDLESGMCMNRLINGDVGSGKSAVAYAAAKMVADTGKQVLLMAPTVVLAEQLHAGYVKIFGGERVEFLSSRQSRSERRQICENIRKGISRVIFGTHAVLSDEVVFSSLSLVITDEQQRFGVAQREKALTKAQIPHNLYLTATPIPRTLAMTFFANLDVSRLDELPAGRLPVATRFIDDGQFMKMIAFMQSRIDKGEQAYVVLPDIERGVRRVEGKLKKLLKARIQTVHGEMRAEELDEVMRSFRAGEIDVLVATTIVEVGVDNPNATVMVIVDSERFGLSQLHQLRGRVGRGKAKSHCFLLSSHREITERMEVLLTKSSGFEIAERDLELRGPGVFLGERQSGAFRLRFDFTARELERAFEAAQKAILVI